MGCPRDGGLAASGVGPFQTVGPVSGSSRGGPRGERCVGALELGASVWTCGFEHTEFWNRVQTCLRVRVGPRVPGSHLRPLVGHRACPEHPRRGREHVQCLDLRVGLRLSPGSQGPGGEGGVPGGGRERSRLIFYILSAAMQGGAQRTRACRRLRAFRVVHAVG